MAVTFTLELPTATHEQLAPINESIVKTYGGPPPGLIAHVESARAGGGITVVDIWESQAQFERFLTDTLGPSLAAAGIDTAGAPSFQPVLEMFGHGIDTVDYMALAQMFYDAFTKNDPSVSDMFTEDYVDHDEIPGIPQNRDGVKMWLDMMHGAFSALTFTPLEVVGHGGKGAVRLRITGTHTGDFMGIPATGRAIAVEAMDYVHLTPEGRCREHWSAMDYAALMAQLGIPAQAGSPSIDLPAEHRV